MGYLVELAMKAVETPGHPPLDRTPEGELRRLVPLVTSHLDYFRTEQEHAEALENALRHPELSLPFWRGKAKQLGLER